MNKKKLLISGVVLLVILLVVILIFVFIKNKNNKVTEEVKFDTKVVSSLTMDINPSIKLELNKDDKVVNVYALNEDAKDIISNDYKEKNIDDVIKNITDSLVAKEYFKEDTTIIINVTGNIKSETVKEIIMKEAKINDVNVNILEPNITASGKKVASLRGATVGTGKYCDILAPESVVALSQDGTCSYKVTISYRTNTCIYYVAIETGEVIGSPSCVHKDVTEGENQCIIMEDMGLTKREMFYYKGIDNGNEYVSRVEDVYGVPDENGQTYIYEYRVSKATGIITKKEKIDIVR